MECNLKSVPNIGEPIIGVIYTGYINRTHYRDEQNRYTQNSQLLSTVWKRPIGKPHICKNIVKKNNQRNLKVRSKEMGSELHIARKARPKLGCGANVRRNAREIDEVNRQELKI